MGEGALTDEARLFLLRELGGSAFISHRAIGYIREQADTHISFSYTDAGLPLTIHWILSSSGRDKYPRQMVRKVSARAAALMRTLRIQRPLVLWLIPAPGERRLPPRGSMLREEHINGGFTYTSVSLLTPANIFVYRAEELPKVVLHEIIHHSQYHTEQWDPSSLHRLYQHLGVDPTTRLLPNEAIVELWAEHYHMMFLSQETGIPYATLWQAEEQHARKQARRLMAHYRDRDQPLWQETTNGMPYIILRAALFPLFHSHIVPMATPYDSRALTDLMIRGFDALRAGIYRGRARHGDRSLRMTLTGDF